MGRRSSVRLRTLLRSGFREGEEEEEEGGERFFLRIMYVHFDIYYREVKDPFAVHVLALIFNLGKERGWERESACLCLCVRVCAHEIGAGMLRLGRILGSI